MKAIAMAVLIACCCRVQMTARPVTATELCTVAEHACRAQLADNGNAEIVFIGARNDMDVQGEHVTVVARPFFIDRPAGPVTVTLDIVADGKTAAVVRVPLRVSLTREVPVAARDIARGQVISGSDIMLQRVTLAAIPRTLIVEAAGVIGQRARCRIPRASRLYERMVEQPPAVTGKETITVVADAGRCRVAFQAHAQQDGRVGDRIKVLNPANNRVIRAVVTGPGTVRIAGGRP